MGGADSSCEFEVDYFCLPGGAPLELRYIQLALVQVTLDYGHLCETQPGSAMEPTQFSIALGVQTACAH